METYAAAFLHSDYDWARCALKLLEGPLFHRHRGYVRRRMFGRLRKEQSTVRLLLVAMVLLYDGRENKKVFELMQEEGLFARLVELVRAGRECDPFMWRICLELLYEMSRIQRLSEASLGECGDVRGL